MMRLGIPLWIMLFMGIQAAFSQISADCSTAVPICNNTPVNGGTNGMGIDDFNGSSRTGCFIQGSGTVESNSAWYRFRTGASGQLGFNIGFDASEDWDFALYRSDDCNSLGEPIRCNFFDNSDNEVYMGVGESPAGTGNTFLYEDWLQVSPGEEYYLLVNNFSNTNSGFSIQFSGNIFVTNPDDALDCSIISNLLGPPLAVCDNENVVLDATTTTAVNYEWFADTGSGFLPIMGAHDPTLQPTTSALYRVSILTTGGNLITSDVQVEFSIAPTSFPVLDEIFCSDMVMYDLSQKDSEALGGQHPNDFTVSYHRSMDDAVKGMGSLPKLYPLSAGNEIIYVRTSSIKNPNCFDVSQQFQLTVVETPVANFPLEVFLCEGDITTVIGDLLSNPNYSYSWDSGETTSSLTVSRAGTYTVVITNQETGIRCESTWVITIVISRTPEISDVLIEHLQNNNVVTILSDREGDFEYRLDDGGYQSEPIFEEVLPGIHEVTINDLNGCGADVETITVVGFPKFFTPNGDGVNDEWQIAGVSELTNPVVFIYDRYGKFIKQLHQNDIGWDGTLGGKQLPSSDYWFKLTYVNDEGQNITAKYINNHFSLRR